MNYDDVQRSWLEIDLKKLVHNLKQFQAILSSTTKVMAVLKADACSHGAVILAKKLNQEGIQYFAVATLQEAIELRENKMKGEILILGYTDLKNISFLKKFNLTQTIVDQDYALELEKLQIKIKCHIKIDTGMHRLGIDCNDFQIIQKIYSFKNLNITGIYSHLSVSDSNYQEDIFFTEKQIRRYDQVIHYLKENHINPGLTHLQSTYGIINYPNLKYDLVRLGTGLYGMKSFEDDYIKLNLDLHPILSFKTKIASIKMVKAKEYLGYGNSYQFQEDKKIAILTVGFGDGYKRSLSNCGAVIIENKQAPIIGRICMDQMMVDITGIEVTKDSLVTLIGSKMPIEQVAKQANIMTNEFLVNINKRVAKRYIN